ncbi:MAG: YdcF family protein [Candidatus Paceibacterota bacterium]
MKVQEELGYPKTIIIAPGFEDNKKHSGLFWDTENRLEAAVVLFRNNEIWRIIVGGGKLRKMQKSFAELMREYLIERGIPKEIILIEEYTFDTPSQIEWIKKKVEERFIFVTDSRQALHIKALLKGFKINGCDILTTEYILCKMSNGKVYWIEYFQKLHKSFYWKKWVIREKILELFTRFFDPRGELISKLTSKRKK